MNQNIDRLFDYDRGRRNNYAGMASQVKNT